jgi:hypothetical protein
MTVLQEIAPAGAPTRVRVLVGEDADAGRRGDKTPIARSDCRFRCRDATTVDAVIEALRASDERLRSRPEELMLWDWECTWFEAAPDTDGGTVHLGVAWYDEAFFAERRDAWFGRMHTTIYGELGLTLDDIDVEHWRRIAA